MNNKTDIKKLHDEFMKKIEKGIGKKVPSLTVFENKPESLEQTKKQLETAVTAKEAAIKRWDEEIDRHKKAIARFEKQAVAEKELMKAAAKAEKEAVAKPVGKRGKKELSVKSKKSSSTAVSRKKTSSKE